MPPKYFCDMWGIAPNPYLKLRVQHNGSAPFFPPRYGERLFHICFQCVARLFFSPASNAIKQDKCMSKLALKRTQKVHTVS